MGEIQDPLLVGLAGIKRDENFVEGDVVSTQRQPRPHRPRRVVLVADHELQGHLDEIPFWQSCCHSAPEGWPPVLSRVRRSATKGRRRQRRSGDLARRRNCSMINVRSERRLRLRGAQARCHENSAYIPRRPIKQSFSAPPGLARLSLRTPESATRFRLSSSTCALLREALPLHRQGLSSSAGLLTAERLLLLRSSSPPIQATFS